MDIKTFENLCVLSKLDFTDTQKAHMLSDMSSIVELMDTIKEFDLTYDDTKDTSEISMNELREDVCLDSFPVEKLMQNTLSRDNCYVIPKMLD